ncbi:hypothetical protein [Nocardioides sp. KR10-350]|uniref:hypothetical protein n=1 Tax=Nocardioides cheoyonin TaxID=3156615 RepID=UPI0032B545ED
MSHSTTNSAVGGTPHPVAALREQLTHAMTAASQLRVILSAIEDPGRGVGESR